jgi:hypothetical protein
MTAGRVPIMRLLMPGKPLPVDGSSLRIFVRRGALRRFDKLKRDAAELPVTVEWDRRSGDGQAAPPDGAPDRPIDVPERRHDPPFTWKVADFVVVGSPDGRPEGDGQPAADRRRRKGDPTT